MHQHEFEDHPRYLEFNHRMRELVTEFQDILAPRPEDFDCGCVPDTESMLLDKVVSVITFIDGSGSEWMMRAHDKMPVSQWMGLFHRQLYNL